MNNIQEYSFVDCLMLDFTTDKTVNTIEFIAEAYYPLMDNATLRKKGRIRVALQGIITVSMKINEEFTVDVLRAYDPEGDDYKANEIYSIQAAHAEKNLELILESDFLEMKVEAQKLEVMQLD